MSRACYGDTALKLIKELKRHQQTGGVISPYRDDSVRHVIAEMKFLSEDIARLVKRLEASRGGSEDYFSSGDSSAMSDIRWDGQDPAEVQRGLITAIRMHQKAIYRNKRCLLAYHKHRLDRIKSVAWEFGGGAAAASVGGHHTNPTSSTSTTSHSSQPTSNRTNGNDTSNEAASLQQNSSPMLHSGLPMELKNNMSPAEHEFLTTYRKLLDEMKGEFLDIDLGAPLVPPKELFIEVRVLRGLGNVVLPSGDVENFTKHSQYYVRRTDVEKFITLGYMIQI